MLVCNQKKGQVEFTRSIKDIVKAVRRDVNTTAQVLGCSEDELAFAHKVISDEAFVESFKKSGEKYLCTRLRHGFIGEKVTLSNGGSYIQSERSKPYGSMVAIPNKCGTVTLGISYINEEPKNNPYAIVGLAEALRRAISAREKGIEGIEIIYTNDDLESQVRYFNKRALAYFNPEVYSFSRGQESTKVVYDNYNEIYNRRKMILGESKLKSPASKK